MIPWLHSWPAPLQALALVTSPSLGLRQERLTDEEEDLILESKPKLFSIGIMTISKERFSLLNIGVLKIKINEESKP